MSECLYCKQPKCGCTYRVGRKGTTSTELWKTHPSTIGEMKMQIMEIFRQPNDTPCVFKISVTYLPANPESPKEPE